MKRQTAHTVAYPADWKKYTVAITIPGYRNQIVSVLMDHEPQPGETIFYRSKRRKIVAVQANLELS